MIEAQDAARRPVRRLLPAVLAVAGLTVVILCGPVAGWLQARDAWLPSGGMPDGLYLVSGERDQNRRIEALAAYVEAVGTNGRIVVLVGNEQTVGPYSRDAQRLLTVGEWAFRKLVTPPDAPTRDAGPLAGSASRGRRWPSERAKLSLAGRSGAQDIRMVPGRFLGTDGEMRALADYLATRPDLRCVALVTSPFHARRALKRLRSHLHVQAEIRVLPLQPLWQDRAPWTVLVEVAKLARDAAGLADAPFLTRKGWGRVGLRER